MTRDPHAFPWENDLRSHRWSVGRLRDDERHLLSCLSCGQTRLVWFGALGSVRWGCARVPFWYRLRLWLRGKSIPAWDCNTLPPWLKRVPKLDPRYFTTYPSNR